HERYRLAFSEDPDDPQVLAGLGSLYTLHHGSYFAGLEMMKQSLRMRKDMDVHRKLFLDYLTVGAYNSAALLVGESYLTIEELFQPEIQEMRAGLSCLREPDLNGIQQLEQLPRTDWRDFYLILCHLHRAESVQTEARTRAQELQQELQTRTIACRALSFWPENDEQHGEWRDRLLKDCRSEFPGMIALFRKPFPDISAYNQDRARSIFDMDIYKHEDPGWEPPPGMSIWEYAPAAAVARERELRGADWPDNIDEENQSETYPLDGTP
ncbi:MAG: hypothetical protein KDK34_00655, partial [Leptospiraceae bacterium]|nr:hypothetical protein [Leptospiraceae bacterium]